MENVNEVKLAKFEIMLKEASKWLYGYRGNYSKDGYVTMPFYFPLTDKNRLQKYRQNVYFTKIYDVCFNKVKYGDVFGPNLNEISNIINEIRNSQTLEINVIGGKVDPNPASPFRLAFGGVESNCTAVETYKLRGGIIFLLLLTAAVNDDFYSNEINMVSDLAYMLAFTEDMMSDWVESVKYLLDGNRFSETMPLEFKTPEANLFFKHRQAETVTLTNDKGEVITTNMITSIVNL